MRWTLLYSMIFLLVCSMASADIVGMWLFDEEGDEDIAVDSSEKGHEMSLHDGFHWVDGKFGKGIELDATGYMRIEHHEDFNFPDAYTIMVWANISDIIPDLYVGMPRNVSCHMIWWLSVASLAVEGLPSGHRLQIECRR